METFKRKRLLPFGWGCSSVGQLPIKRANLPDDRRAMAHRDARPGFFNNKDTYNFMLRQIEEGKIDPSFVVIHRLRLDETPHGYDIFRKKDDGCIKVIMKP
jgi:threonine dehydrogenase-like Zn-dependent dehydrogenase